MYLFLLIAAVIFILGVWRYAKYWVKAQKDPRGKHWGKRIVAVLDLAFSQTRVRRDRIAGIMHMALFWGFIGMFITTMVVAAQADLHIMMYHGLFYLLLTLISDLGGFVALVGIIVFFWRRYVKKINRTRPSVFDDGFAIGLIFVILLTGFILEGCRIAVLGDPWQIFSPFGALAGLILGGASDEALMNLHRFLWWFHMLCAMGFIAYMPFSKLLHIFLSPVNILFESLDPKGYLAPGVVDGSIPFGAGSPNGFTWKQLLETNACMRCGRCQEKCPAYNTGKPLSPKNMTNRTADFLVHPKKGEGDMIDKVITRDGVWSCVTCLQCEHECPVLVEHTRRIVQMRRHLVMAESEIPSEVKRLFRNLEKQGNPWGEWKGSRANWASGLAPTLAENPDAEVVLWVGCAGAYDQRAQQISIATAKILTAAKVNFAIIGNEETCCGDSARRIGNEYLFQQLAKENVATFKKYNVKTIVATCPHCYNILKNEYPAFGMSGKVYHHTEYINLLIQTGAIDMQPAGGEVATYHDSCYLGRYNDIYEQPRQIIQSIEGMELKDPIENRGNGFCCGGGGGRIWMEEGIGTRINSTRVDQLVKNDPSIIVSACPFCMTMMEDGVQSKQLTNIATMDIAELVLKYMK